MIIVCRPRNSGLLYPPTRRYAHAKFSPIYEGVVSKLYPRAIPRRN